MAPLTRSRITRYIWTNLRAFGTKLEIPRESWSTLRVLGPDRKSPMRASQHHGPSDLVCGHSGNLVNPMGNRTRA